MSTSYESELTSKTEVNGYGVVHPIPSLYIESIISSKESITSRGIIFLGEAILFVLCLIEQLLFFQERKQVLLACMVANCGIVSLHLDMLLSQYIYFPVTNKTSLLFFTLADATTDNVGRLKILSYEYYFCPCETPFSFALLQKEVHACMHDH